VEKACLNPDVEEVIRYNRGGFLPPTMGNYYRVTGRFVRDFEPVRWERVGKVVYHFAAGQPRVEEAVVRYYGRQPGHKDWVHVSKTGRVDQYVLELVDDPGHFIVVPWNGPNWYRPRVTWESLHG